MMILTQTSLYVYINTIKVQCKTCCRFCIVTSRFLFN